MTTENQTLATVNPSDVSLIAQRVTESPDGKLDGRFSAIRKALRVRHTDEEGKLTISNAELDGLVRDEHARRAAMFDAARGTLQRSEGYYTQSFIKLDRRGNPVLVDRTAKVAPRKPTKADALTAAEARIAELEARIAKLATDKPARNPRKAKKAE